MKARKIAALLLSAALAVTAVTGCTSAARSGGSGAQAEATAENGYGLEEFVMVMIPGEDTEKSVQLRDTMAEKMSETIGVPVTTYRATDYSAAVEAMRTGNAQLAYLGPFSYVTARDRAGAECLVVQGEVGTKGGYQSYIVVQADSDIQSLEDLQGKTFAFVDPESTSGNVIPTDEILSAFPDLGLTFDDLHTDGKFFSSAMFAGSHQGSLQAVVQGNVDAAAVASSTYESQIEEGLVNEEDLRIIHESPDIPGSPIAIQKDLPQELKDKVKEFLLNYDDPEYFGDEEGKEPKRFVEISDSDYDYLADLKETYNLSD